MQGLWPWLAVAAAGALHGLNPASGWMFAAWPQPARRLRTLAPIAAGNAAAVALVALAVPASLRYGLAIDRAVLQGAAVALLLVLATHCFLGHRTRHAMQRAGRAGLALWSFVMGTAHGAGLMLVPALMPFCASDMPAREITASGSMLLALGAVALHLAAMLATTAAMAAGARGAWRWVRDRCCAWKARRQARAVQAPSASASATRLVQCRSLSGRGVTSFGCAWPNSNGRSM
jgi:hypothetical protein